MVYVHLKWRARVCLIKTTLFEFISVVHLPMYRSSLLTVIAVVTDTFCFLRVATYESFNYTQPCVTTLQQIHKLYLTMLFVICIFFIPGRWSKPSDGQPSTKYEVVWSGSLATEEG